MAVPRVGVSDVVGWVAASGRATALMQAAHERHVALTPALADALVRLEGAAVPALDPLWGAAFRLMGEGLGRSDLVGRNPFWRRCLPAFPALVAEPVLRAAARRAGVLPLAGPVAIAGAGFPDRAQACRLIEDEVRRLLADPGGMGRGFWIAAALALEGAALVLGRLKAGDALPVLPEVDPLLARLVFEVVPTFDQGFTRRRQRRLRMRAARRRSGERPKEGGVVGIRPSRSLEDLPDAMMSEMLLPDELMANRLLHEGLLVRHRPPLREPRRDLLVLTLIDRRRGVAGPLALVKAAWADAAVRLRLVLAAAGLSRSDLLLADRTPLRQAGHALRVDDGGRLSLADPFDLPQGTRAGLLVESGLFPDLVNALPRPLPEGDADLAALAKAAMQALAPLRAPGQRAAAPPRPADYATRLVVVCLAADSAEGRLALTDWAAFRALVVAATARLSGPPTAIGALVVAPEWRAGIGALGGVRALSDVPGLTALDIAPGGGDLSPEEVLSRLSGDLSGWFADLVMGAVDA